MRGKWRLDVTLELPNGETQDVLARLYLRQVDEVVQTAITKTGDPDIFDIDELELALDLIAHEKAPGHDDFSLEIIKQVFRYNQPSVIAFLVQ